MRALIVDDEPMGRLMLATFLEEFGRCDEAQEGNEAVALYIRALETGEPYDVVCLDIMMPGMDGQQTLLALRKLERERGAARAKIFMISASRSLEDVSRAFFEGDCDDYIDKPFVPEEMHKIFSKHSLF